MKRPGLKSIVTLISIALLVLVGLQLYNANELYERKAEEFNEKINNTLISFALKHEKANDILSYSKFFGGNLRSQYKNALKEEFQNIFPVEESVSISDTVIFKNGKLEKYHAIRGTSFDSLSGVSISHKVMVKDINEVSDLINLNGLSAKDSTDLAYRLDRQVKSQLIQKSKFVNKKMLDVYRNITAQTPQQRINLAFLDSIICGVLEKNKIKSTYTYCVTDAHNKIINFPAFTDLYNTKLDLTKAHTTKLFPSNVFEDELFLHVDFNREGKVVLSQIWLTLLISIALIALIMISFYVMFKAILNERKLSDLKNDFINNMTHEFKTPISTISLACEALNDEDMVGNNAPEIKPFVSMINDENKRLGNLVERILQSAVIDRGDLKLKRDQLELNELVAKVVGKAKLRVEAKNGIVNLDLNVGMLPFYGDRMHTVNLISNLVDNAIKYSKDKVIIDISTKKIGNNYILTVSDQGIGIKNEHLDKIFDKLFRVPTGNVHDVKGFGLGLSYVKAIADLENWDIKADSKVGQGSTFTLTIKENTTNE